MLAPQPLELHLTREDLDVLGVELFELRHLRIVERIEQCIDDFGSTRRVRDTVGNNRADNGRTDMSDLLAAARGILWLSRVGARTRCNASHRRDLSDLGVW